MKDVEETKKTAAEVVDVTPKAEEGICKSILIWGLNKSDNFQSTSRRTKSIAGA